MATEAMSMLNCSSKYQHGNPFGVPGRSLSRNFSIIANGLGMKMCTDEFDGIEDIFRDVTRKHLSARQICSKQQDAIHRIEEELRNRISGIFSTPPPKLEKMLLAAYRIITQLHRISRQHLTQREKKGTSFLSDHSNVLDLTLGSDSDETYIDTGIQDTESELDVESGSIERRESLRPHRNHSTAQTVLQTVETPQLSSQGNNNSELQVSKYNSQQNNSLTATPFAMSRSVLNRARAQRPLKYPYILEAKTMEQHSNGRDKENISVISGLSSSSNAANRDVHRHRGPLTDIGASNSPEISAEGKQLPIIKQEGDPIIILSSPPRSRFKNTASKIGARKPRQVPEVVISTKPPTKTPQSISSQAPILTTTVIERFLHTCQPPMVHLLPLFRISGCVTAPYLRSIAKRRPEERETLLRKILVQPGHEEDTVVVSDIDIWMLDLHLAGYEFGHEA
ncbi:hypothetical protein D9619_004711 [Psilocybe cf. subviscida]|uniref:Uncharacterized protein n=1 Tax=Psilocybe cf. subviscida TaxID=2480587 RepID=A0A8H5BSK8_9AGAR|nr:hypothetical protein D9619_004711 [Psilocybe cf. subviscida]